MDRAVTEQALAGQAATERMQPREIAPGVHWLGGCHEVAVMEGQPPVGHTHTAAYLLLGSEKTLLYDTGHPEKWPEMRPDLERILDGRPLDYLFPSHSEVPHGGNLGKLLRMYPGARVVGDTRDWHLIFPRSEGRVVDTRIGDSVDLGGGQRIVLVEALIRDLPTTVWAYDTKNRILFCSDGFAYRHNSPLYQDDIPIHQAGQCSKFVSEWGYDPVPGQVEDVMTRALYIMKFIEYARVIDQLPEFFKKYPTDMIGPAHGCIIDDVAMMLPIAKEAHRSAYARRPTA